MAEQTETKYKDCGKPMNFHGFFNYIMLPLSSLSCLGILLNFQFVPLYRAYALIMAVLGIVAVVGLHKRKAYGRNLALIFLGLNFGSYVLGWLIYIFLGRSPAWAFSGTEQGGGPGR